MRRPARRSTPQDTPISADRQLHLTLVLPDGTVQPIALPAEAEAGRAAAKIAQTLSLDDGSGTQGWTLVRDASGHPLAAGAMFSELGLIPDERVRLISQPTVPQAFAPAPGLATPPAQPVLPAPAAPPTGSPRSTTPTARYALIGGFGVLIATIAVLATLLATGGSNTPTAGSSSEAGIQVPDSEATSDGSDTASDDRPGDDSGDDSTYRPGALPARNASLGQTPLSQSGGVTSFTVDLPTSWSAAKLDVPQDTGSSTVTRTRTELRARSGGASIVIDALTGFDTSARDNRATLDESYAASQPGYRRVEFVSVPVGATAGYEWRYELFDEERGRMARRANVMFDLGGMSFAVLASGTTTTPYAELSTLARRVARSIQA